MSPSIGRGNHDSIVERLDWDGPVLDVARVFIQDPGMSEPRAAWLSHYAHRTWPHRYHGDLHLHGHSHGELAPIENSLDDGVDCWNWRPVTLDQMLARLPQPSLETVP